MDIVAADPDEKSLAVLCGILSGLFPQACIRAFTDPMYAVKYGLKHPVHLLFTEIRLNQLDGLTLIRMMRQKYPNIQSVVVTDTDRYRAQAQALQVDAYLRKPVARNEICQALTRLGVLPAVEERGTRRR